MLVHRRERRKRLYSVKTKNKNRNNGKIVHVDTTVNRCWYLDETVQAYSTVMISSP